jgi:hypothetical protein
MLDSSEVCIRSYYAHLTDIYSLEGVETKAPWRAPVSHWRRAGMGVRDWETDTRLGKTVSNRHGMPA